MGLVRYTSPKGLDREIDLIQNKLYNYLTSTAYGWTSYNCYPRAYINKNGEKNTIEYTVNSKDYEDVLFNDTIYASSFFVLINTDKFDIRREKARIALIFQIRLNKLKSSVTTRVPDEDITNEIAHILIYKMGYSVKNLNTKRGVKDVYSDLGVDMKQKNEMSENFVCRFDIDLYYETQEPSTTSGTIT